MSKSDDEPEIEESYDYDEPTPADDVLNTASGQIIMRMGEPPIPVGSKTKEEKEQ